MCIALLSTAHPHYQLILLSNRDEYLNRPTAQATWWSPTPTSPPSILSGRDLLRPAQGTWLGLTTTGRIAVLTNYRDTDNPTPPPTPVSRGEIIKRFLTSPPSLPTPDFAASIINSGTARDAGGFSLVCGTIGTPLSVLSNRAASHSSIPSILGPTTVQTVGLSNTGFTDRTWPKVTRGEELLLDAIRKSTTESWTEDDLIRRFLEILSLDTLPRVSDDDKDDENEGLATYVRDLRNTIFVPVLGSKKKMMRGDEVAAATSEASVEVVGTDLAQRTTETKTKKKEEAGKEELGVSGLYGTQKQTVVLVDHDNNIRFFERTLFDQTPSPVPVGQGDVDVKFRIEKPV